MGLTTFAGLWLTLSLLVGEQVVGQSHRQCPTCWQPAEEEQHLVLDRSADYRATRLAANLLMQSQRSEDVETFYIRKGANGTLPCLPLLPGDSQAAMSKIEWWKEERKLVEAEAKHLVVWNTKNSIAYLPESGALLFRGVTNEDSGEYHCLVSRSSQQQQQQQQQQQSGDSQPVVEDGVVRFYVQDVPDPPQMPIIEFFTQRSVNISWVPSFDYHYSPILHYVIHVREGLKGQWDVANGIMTPDNRTSFEVIGLKPFTTYLFRVLAVNAIGVGEPSPVSHPIITLREKPDSRPNILSARNVSSTSIKLEWEQPSAKEIHGEFLGYRIRYVHQLHEHAPAATSEQELLGTTGSTGVGYHQLSKSGQQRSFAVSSSSTQLQQPSVRGNEAKEQIVGDPNQTSYVIKGLSTYTPYRISVQVMNPAGDGPAAEVLAMTDEGVPSPPLELTVLKVLDHQVKLRWLEPKSPNGILQGYQINLIDVTNNLNESRKLIDPQSVMEHTIGELKPYTHYKVTIQAYSRKFLGELSPQVKFRTDVSAPSAPQLVNVTCYSQDSILIQWQRPEKVYHQIDYYYVHYKPDSAWQFNETTMMAKNDKLINQLLITELQAEQLYELYVSAGTKSSLDTNLVYKGEPSPTLRVVLQPNCESYTAYPVTENTFSTSLAIGVVCATFALVLVIASLIVWRRHCQAAYYYLDDPQTASRGTNSPQLSETYDDSEYGSIPVNDWAKHVQKLHADSDVGFSRQFGEIQKASSPNLSSEHSQLLENKQKNRYINIVAYDHTRVTLRPMPGQKKLGSDYINANFIDGYNKPRAYIGTQGPLVSTFDDYWRMIWEQKVVIIVMITNLQERGRRKCDMYWPKEGTETYGHIQVKLLQEVVMATYTLRTFTAKNLKMKKRSGAERTVYQYHYTNWPDHGVPDHPLPVLSFVRKSASANPPGAGAIICHCSAGCGRSGTYIVIDAMLKQIRHRSSINVVDFLKHIRNQRNFLVQTEEQYVFIHDALVEAIESGDTEIASNFIAKYIQLLQTGGTSTTINQKNSTYSIAANGVANQSLNDCRQQALSVTSDNQLIANSQSNLFLAANGGAGGGGSKSNVNTTSRSQSSIAGQWSLLERQYRLVASFKAKDFNVVSALKPCNKIKNRTLNLIPLEAHRVHITQKPGVDGSDYINATFLMGFNHLREFIVTQHPVYETFSDFWQMVYDHNSQTIVLLTQMDDLKEYPQFWPQKEDEVDYGSFKVKLIQESTTVQTCDERCVIVTRDFIMRSNQDDYELQTKIIHCPGWPDTCGPLAKVFDLIQVVQNATQQQASQQKLHDGNATSTTVTIGQEHEPQNGGPIIVVDKHGGTEAATFAVLTTLFKQINFEDAVDVYMYAKLAHLRRPGIWSSQDDYLFLYRAIENYASSCLAEAAANNTSSQGGQASIIPAINFHHQTMTLDRHKHKSTNASLKGTSTMRRNPSHANNNQPANFVNFDPTLTASKNKNQLLLDHNHNQVEPPNVAQQQTITTNHIIERKMMANQAQLIKASLPNNANSPYSSAVSIGTSPHRHLLATNGSRNSSQQLPPQQQQQQPDMDHYLYPMN